MHILMKRIIVSSLAVYLTLGLVACMGATSTGGGGPSRPVADQDIDEDDDSSSVLSVVYNGERYTIETSRFVIGSDPSADLVIDDESIAAKHAVVIRDAEGYRI